MLALLGLMLIVGLAMQGLSGEQVLVSLGFAVVLLLLTSLWYWTSQRLTRKRTQKGRRVQQNRVAPVVNTDVSFTAQTVVSGDRREVRMTMSAVFNNVVTRKEVRPVFSIIPGVPRP